jgi:hypothetical protein
MPGKKTMEQAKKLGMKSKGYKAGKKVKMNMGMKVPTFNEVARMKTGGKV